VVLELLIYSEFRLVDVFALIISIVTVCFAGQFEEDQLRNAGISLDPETEGIKDYQQGLGATGIAGVPDR
jgi:hypothetical protein